ncbi:MAG TPA: hypothetical protein PKN32_12915 [Bacteroidales bacterium]|nr:hypothetical protein [Bacteroidales bacterium]
MSSYDEFENGYDHFHKELSNKPDERITDIILNMQDYDPDAVKAAISIAKERNLEIKRQTDWDHSDAEGEELEQVIDLDSDIPYIFPHKENEEQRKRREEREEEESVITNEDVASGLNHLYTSWIIVAISFVLCMILGLDFENRGIAYSIMFGGVIISTVFKLDFFKNSKYSGREFSSMEIWLAEPFITKFVERNYFSARFRRYIIWLIIIIPIVVFNINTDYEMVIDQSFSIEQSDLKNPYLGDPVVFDDTVLIDYNQVSNFPKTKLIEFGDSLKNNGEYKKSLDFYFAALSNDKSDTSIYMKIAESNYSLYLKPDSLCYYWTLAEELGSGEAKIYKQYYSDWCD